MKHVIEAGELCAEHIGKPIRYFTGRQWEAAPISAITHTSEGKVRVRISNYVDLVFAADKTIDVMMEDL